MQVLFQQKVTEGRTAFVACTDKSDGDLSLSSVDTAVLADRRRAVLALPWTVCRQVHSDRLLPVARDGHPAEAPSVADALIMTETDHVVAVHSADCVPVGFIHEAGAVAASHAGWKGLERGVLESTVRALRNHAAGQVHAVVGPHIRAPRYEFGEQELCRLARRFGSTVVGRTIEDTPALDLTNAVAHELDRLAVPVAYTSAECTAEQDDRYWSYRARKEQGRFALLTWMTA